MSKMTHIFPAPKQAKFMREYLLSDMCSDLEILITGVMKSKYYICIRVLIFFDFWSSSKWLKNDSYSVPSFLPTD